MKILTILTILTLLFFLVVCPWSSSQGGNSEEENISCGQGLTNEELSLFRGQGEGKVVIQELTNQRVILWDEINKSIDSSNISTGKDNVQQNTLMILGW